MNELSRQQANVLGYIQSYIVSHGYPPTLREIGAHLGGQSTNAVNDILKRLEVKGYIARDSVKARTIRILAPPRADVSTLEALAAIIKAIGHYPRAIQEYALLRAISQLRQDL